MRLGNKVFIFIFILLLLPSLATLSYSQTPAARAARQSDILNEEFKTKQEELKKIPEKPVEIKIMERPAVVGEEKFFIKKINLLGCESFAPETFSFIISKYENREISFTELKTLCKEIEQEYLQRGVIAAIFVPPQEVKNQIMSLQVVEAKMGELKIEEHKYFKKDRLNYYWKIKPGEILRYDKLMQCLQEMNKNPDRKVKAVLHAGKNPGTTDVILTAQTKFPLHFESTFDREGVVSSGRSRTTVGLRYNNLLGLDDMLISGRVFGDDFNGNYVYHTIPVSGQGTYLMYGYNHSMTMPKKEFATYGIKSISDDWTVSINQDIFNKEKLLGNVYLGFDANNKTIKFLSNVSNAERLRVFNLGANLTLRGSGTLTLINPEVSQGVDALGATDDDNALASRGASPTFTKFSFSLQHSKALPRSFQANFRFKSLVSSTKLTPQEQFNLGGIDSVRGYPAADYQADNAVFTSVELLTPAFFVPLDWKMPYSKTLLKDQITPLVFIDYGWGMKRGALPTEKEEANLLSAGVGLRFRLFDKVFIRTEWGFPIADNHPSTESGDSKFHFSVNFEY